MFLEEVFLRSRIGINIIYFKLTYQIFSTDILRFKMWSYFLHKSMKYKLCMFWSNVLIYILCPLLYQIYLLFLDSVLDSVLVLKLYYFILCLAIQQSKYFYFVLLFQSYLGYSLFCNMHFKICLSLLYMWDFGLRLYCIYNRSI